MMAFCPEHPKWDQNPKFTPLSTTTSIPTPFICGVPPGLWTQENVRCLYLSRLTLWKIYELLVETKEGACCRGTQQQFSVKFLFGEAKIAQVFLWAWGRLKIFFWPFHSRTIFEAYLIDFLRFSEVQCFTFHSLGKLIFRRKRKSKISDSKMQW